jgi:hypothetical protein
MSLKLDDPVLRALKLRPLTFEAIVERIDRLNRHERSLLDRINRRFDRWAEGYLGHVNAQFYRYFTNRWDLAVARSNGVDQDLTTEAVSQLGAMEDELASDIETEVEDSYESGFLFALWDLYRSGVIDEADIEEGIEFPDEDTFDGWLTLSAIGGLTIADRLGRWIRDAQLKARQGVRAAIARELSLNDTGLMLETLADQASGRIGILAGSEIQRSFYSGQTDALRQALGPLYDTLVVGEMWWTRLDGAVCQICATLHGQVTPLVPIDDSHPGCRCRKIPLLRWDALGDRTSRPIRFSDFEQALTE